MQNMSKKARTRTPKASLLCPSLLKRFFVVLGAITFLFLVLLGAGIGYGAYLCYALAPSGQAYVDESVRAIINTWSKDELIKRSSPELRANTTQGQLDQAFATFNKLGSFQSYGGAQGSLGLSLNVKKGLIITATYHATATFQHGVADIKIGLIRHDNDWQIESFHGDQKPYPFYLQ
jgi:hypothetical protein